MNALARRKPHFLLTTGLLALLVGLGALFWRAERRHATVSALDNTVLTLAEEADFDRRLLDGSVDQMRAQAHFFAELPAVGDAISGEGQESVRQRLQQVFAVAIQHGDDIARMSYIEVTAGARELVRVERNAADRLPRVATPGELNATTIAQELPPALALPPGEIHLSLRHDPTRPQLRFLKPIRNTAGKVTGMLLMDRDLNPLLSQLGQPSSHPGANRHETCLTDLQGHYLLHPQHPSFVPPADPARGSNWDSDFKRVDDPAARLGSPLPSGLQALTAWDGSLWLARMDELPLSGVAGTDALRLWQMIPWTSVQSTIGTALADQLKLGAAMGGLLAAGLGVGMTLLALTRSRPPADRGSSELPAGSPERRGALQAGLLATLMGLLAGGGAVFVIGRMDAEVANSHAESAATIAIERVADALDDSEHLLEALRQLPLRDIRNQEEFARRVAGLARKAGQGVTLLWSPEGVVRYSFPLAGNEAAIGHDLRADARVGKLVQASIQSGLAHWDGPYELRQGGMGMVLRMPVYRDDAPPGEAAFTGVATSVVNLSLLMRRLTAERPAHELRAWIANGDRPMTQVWGLAEQPAGEVRTSRALTSTSGMALRVEVAAWPREAASAWRLVARALGLGLAAGLLGALAFALESWRSGLRELGKESLKNQVLLQTATDGIHIVDDQGNLRRFSDSFARMLGYTGEEIRRLKIQDWDTSPVPDGFPQLLKRLAGAPEGVRYESRYRRKDGSLIEVEIACRLVSIEGRTVFCGAARDVSERKQAEAALRASEDRLQRISDNAGVSLCSFDMGRRYRTVNRAYAGLVGMPTDQIVGQRLDLIIGEVSARRLEPAIERVLLGESLTFQSWMEYPVAGRRFVQISLTPDLTLEGRVQGWFAGITDLTEREEALTALRRSEEEFRTLVEFAPSGIVMVNAEGRICMVNGRLESDTGYLRQELLGQSVEVLVPVRHVHAHAAHRQRYTGSPGVRPMGAGTDLHVRRKDGSEFPAEIALTPIETPLGRMVVASIQNISLRKAAEAALAEQFAFQRTLLTGAGAAIIATTTEGTITLFNPAAEELIGYRADEMVGKLTPAVFHDPAEVVARAAELSAELGRTIEPGFEVLGAKTRGGNPETREWTYVRKDGARVPVLLTVSALRNDTGAITGFLGVGRDITERKAAEAARLQHIRTLECVDKLNTAFRRVNNREGTLEAALDEIAGIIPCGTAFLLAPSDPSAAEWGVTTHSASDRSRRRIVQGLRGPMTPETAAAFRQIHAASDPIAFGPAEPAAVPAALAGTLQSQAGLGISLRTQGAPPWILWLSQDNTGAGWDTEARWLLTALARRMEDLLAVWLSAQEILRLNSELEQRVDARSMELEVTNEILKRSNQDLAQFASIASHDLKSPLRAIDTLAAWISEDLGENQSPAIRENLRLMRQRVRRMERLLADLLAYSRADKVKDAVRPVQVREMVAEITALIEVPPGFRVQLLGEPAGFTTAATPLRTVLQNLVNNAVKHHDRKTGLIEISVLERGDFYEFQVDDDGPGIPPEHHERIWGMFQTLQPRDKVEGSGIGLALIKRLVQHYGGVVGVQNRTPRGARFSFTWP
ncbi:MAG: PAS domain S-box protein, partial [Proteobacteria bacterium]|nr:PAS domain S-box protein [Pseudomonadota bacterium]